MSIGKEVEKMYRDDAEKQKKKQKKKKRGRLATIIVLILLILVILLLGKALGLFGGGGGLGLGSSKDKGDDDGSTVNNSVTVSDSSEEESSVAEEPKVYDDIKVSGSTYLYKGSEISLEDLKDTFSMEKMNVNVVARIGDDNATQNTMEQLTSALEEMGREYVIESVADDSSTAEAAE